MNLTTELTKDGEYVFLNERKQHLPHYKIAERQKEEKKTGAAQPISWRKQTFAENNKCHYCACEMVLPIKGKIHKPNTATIDHKLPRCRGGKNEAANKVLACNFCNGDKADLTEEEYFAVLSVRAKYKTEAKHG